MPEDPEFAKLRDAIDQVDRKILDLFAERVRLVLKVGDFKRLHNLQIYDPTREREILERLCALSPEPLEPATVRRLFERLIDESRRLEQHHDGRS